MMTVSVVFRSRVTTDIGASISLYSLCADTVRTKTELDSISGEFFATYELLSAAQDTTYGKILGTGSLFLDDNNQPIKSDLPSDEAVKVSALFNAEASTYIRNSRINTLTNPINGGLGGGGLSIQVTTTPLLLVFKK